ncbi:PAS domain-containing protein [Noviherbaspirillum sp.]|uniref:PAS domain-containing protein n=1 Tax=Noviherbaspirillum sp. TaxID=1926288 RepID=UPI002B48FE22|nr:PAS domain-containing protein [Noviherbaspirillum sp.]HJV80194.1 PAS domain-containing protein [Noviherbaspirillum sp.]
MRQTRLPAPALPRSRLTSVAASGAIILTLIAAAFLFHFALGRQNEGKRSPLELQLALAAGVLFGVALCEIVRTALGKRRPRTKNGAASPPHVSAAWFDRAQVLAQFGTYEIHVAMNTPHESTRWSQEMFRIVGRDPESGSLPMDEYIELYVHPDDQENVRTLVRKALRDCESTVSEYRIRSSDGDIKHIYDYLEFASTTGGEKIFLGQAFDITERKLIEYERLESTARYKTFIEQLGGMQYISRLDEQATNVYISDRVERLLGFTSEEWCADPELRIRQLHEDDRAEVLSTLATQIAGREPLSIDYRIYAKDGSLRWFHDEARIVADSDGEPLFLQGVMFDITERKLAQQDLERSHCELKKLVSALDELREEEQKRLAREMHDDLGQLLAAMKMDLSDLQQYLPQNNVKVIQRLEGINDLVNTMVTSVRRIISDLPPKILEDLGLINAIRVLASNFQKRYKIGCHLDLPEQELAIEQRIATAIYRMVQEALNNVAKHADATQVAVSIELQNESIGLCIADNGKGMTPSAQQKNGSFGLIGIRERAATLKGEVRIESQAGDGTKLHIRLPVDIQHSVESG